MTDCFNPARFNGECHLCGKVWKCRLDDGLMGRYIQLKKRFESAERNWSAREEGLKNRIEKYPEHKSLNLVFDDARKKWDALKIALEKAKNSAYQAVLGNEDPSKTEESYAQLRRLCQ